MSSASRKGCSRRGATRRQFVTGALAGVGMAAGCSGHKEASDGVQLGSTGIRVSRLVMGGGSHGGGNTSEQAKLGVQGFADLLTYGYSKGVTLFDTSDDYGTHAAVASVLKKVGRKNAVVLTKTYANTAEEMEADLERYRTELGTDVIDIVLLHAVTSPTWAQDKAGAMEALERAKQRGMIRAHGVSCHSLEALRLAATTPWVEVDLARINPAGLIMDHSDPKVIIELLRQMKAAGKGVIGMKILAEGRLANDLDNAIGHAVGLDALDAFSIGFKDRTQFDQIVTKISARSSA
jgi:1-deoxyxylulose-5-phosphate synthase